jgi:hypothetical protein
VPPLLGLEELEPSITHPQLEHAKALFGLEATEKQVLNSFGEWERKHKHALQRMPLSRVHGTLAVPAFAAKFAHGIGRVGKIRREKEVTYGVEISLGTPEGDLIKPTKSIRRLLKLSRKIETVPLEEITVLHAGELAKAILANIEEVIQDVAPEFIGTIAKENLVFACFDLAPVEVMAYEDGHGALLFAPQERSIVVKNETGVHTPETTTTDREPRIGSPIHAWRTLGLIDAAGVPTRRGEIFSFFQHGEGLAVAAALEDEGYPLEELDPSHCANLRSGSKFELPYACGSERLSAGVSPRHVRLYQSPRVFGKWVAGGLRRGRCGVARCACCILNNPEVQELRRGVAEGDLSRAYVEWLSLLRHITHAPAIIRGSGGWIFKAAARAALKQHGKVLRHLFHLDLPPLTNKQKHGKTRHYLMVK